MRYQTRHLFILPLILNHLTIFIYPNATFNKIIFYINSFYYKYPFDNNKATNSKPTNLTAKVVVQIETKYAPFIMWKIIIKMSQSCGPLHVSGIWNLHTTWQVQGWVSWKSTKCFTDDVHVLLPPNPPSSLSLFHLQWIVLVLRKMVTSLWGCTNATCLLSQYINMSTFRECLSQRKSLLNPD